MSLQAKIEAVIYASEEPVTLAQLAGLLGEEAQAELDRLADRQASLALDGLEQAPEQGAPEPAEPAAEATTEQSSQPETSGSPEPGEDRPLEGATAPDADGSTLAPDAEENSAAARRLARDRERRLREYFRELLDRLMAEYAASDRGIEIREVAGGFRMGTRPEYHDAVRGFVRSLKPALKLTLQALETLAVVAYKQPVTAPEISEIRGVDSGGVLGSLMARKLVTTAGRKQVIGRPILYKTTKDFLLRFGLKDVSELPSIEEFEKMAGALAEQEEMDMPERPRDSVEANLESERESIAPQADGDSNDLEPNDSNLSGNDLPTLDGRASTIPPNYDQPGDDPSADEAAVQRSEGQE